MGKPQERVKKRRGGSNVRRELTTDQHLGWAGVVIGFLGIAVGRALTVEEIANEVTMVVASVGVASFVVWAFLSGWRIRSPIWRLPRPEKLTPAEQERLASTRKVKDAFTELFHARARPAEEKLRQIVASFAEEMKVRPQPFALCGDLTETYLLAESVDAEHRLRKALEGVMWQEWQKPEHERFRRFIYEMDVKKQSASDIASAFYLYYSNYRLLLAWARRLARVLAIALEEDGRFIDWRKLDEALTSRLRDVLAFRELISYREDFEKVITDWAELGR